jgi:succinate dehydrogenase / fumarate reductase flavoprotein subunit
MYEKIVDENPYQTPMMIYPAVHYTMGGVWVDYDLMTTIPGCFAIEKLIFQITEQTDLRFCINAGLADGYFVLPYTGNYLAADIKKTGKSQ